MDIGKFIDEFVKCKDDASKSRLVKKHIVKDYIPYATKIDEAKKIINLGSFTKDEDGNEHFMLDSPIRYLLKTLCVIRNYTDLEFDSVNSSEQFDLIDKHNVMSYVGEAIGDDYIKFDTILKMVYDDMMINERSLVSFVEKKLDVLTAMIEAMDVPEQTE
jgi:hypothetical protein